MKKEFEGGPSFPNKPFPDRNNPNNPNNQVNINPDGFCTPSSQDGSISIHISREASLKNLEEVEAAVVEIVRENKPGIYRIDSERGILLIKKTINSDFQDQNPGGSSGMHFPDGYFSRPPRNHPFNQYDPDNDEFPPNDPNYFI